jgi:hypothetical protein
LAACGLPARFGKKGFAAVEAALFVVNLIAMLLLVLWAARTDPYGFKQSGRGLFDLKPGAECDERASPYHVMRDF